MKIAVWSVTRNSSCKAIEIKEKIHNSNSGFEIDIFTLEKFNIKNTNAIKNFDEKLTESFSLYKAHIFIMATGIVVRKITKLLKSKDIDPAILVVDENLDFVISLVSGHLGNANEICKKISEIINAVPIITTSSDITGKIAVDTISQKLNARIGELESAKKVTSLIVDDKKVSLILPKNIFINENNSSGYIICSNRENIDITRIYPKNIILGIGCRRGIEKEKIIEAVKKALIKNNISEKSIKIIASINIKSDEKGLLEAAEFFKTEIVFFDKEKIANVENIFVKSDFVKEIVGVHAVSEPCAFLASNKKGKFLEKKFIYDGVTVSIFEEDNLDEQKR